MVVELWLKSNTTGIWTSIDLGGDTSISLNKSFEEIEDFTTRSSSYSKTFTIPQTATNNQFFSSAFMVNSSSFADSVVVDAVVKYGGADIFNGSCRLSSIINSENGGSYDIFLTESLPDFSQTLQDIKLVDLDYSGLTHTLSYSAITETWSFTGGSYNDYAGLTGKILYPLCHYGYDDTQYYSLFFDGLSGFTDSNTPLVPTQFAPWISGKYLVDKIFEKAGFTYDSDFFDSEYFKGIFVLAKTNELQGALVASGSSQNENTFRAVSRSANASGAFFTTTATNTGTTYQEYFFLPTEVSDPLNIFTPSLTITNRQHYFTAIVSGTYKIKLGAEFFSVGTSLALYVNIALKDIDTGVIYGQIQGLPVQAGSQNLSAFGDLYFSLNLNAGARVGMFYSLQPTLGWVADPSSLGIYSSYLEVWDSPGLSGTDDVYLQDNLPAEITALEYFKGIIQLFNLVVIPNGDRSFLIERWDTYFEGGNTLDWSQKIDLSSDYTLEPTNDLQKEYILSYRESEDRYSQQNIQDRNQVFGTYRYISQVPYHTGEILVEIPFEPLPISTFDGESNSTMLLPHLYRFPSKEELAELKQRAASGETITYGSYYQPRGSGLRLGFYNGMLDFKITGTTKNWYLLSGSTAVGFNEFPSISHLSSYGYSASTFSDLNIGNQYDYWQNLTNEYVGFTARDVWSDFWAPRVLPYYDRDVKILTGTFNLTPTEIKNIQFNDRVWFLDAYWRLLSMTDADITQRSKVVCKWIKIPFYPTPQELIAPTYQQTPFIPVPTPTGSTFNFLVYTGVNIQSVCSEATTLISVYSNCSVLTAGCSVFNDTGATNPIDEGTLIKTIGGNTIYQVAENGLLQSLTNC